MSKHSDLEVDRILKSEDIVRFFKYLRLGWLGHVERMEDGRIPKKILHGRVYGDRRRGRPRLHWIDEVEEDLKRLQIIGWRSVAKKRNDWRQIMRQVKAHTGL